MDKHYPNFAFKIMSFIFKFRDLFTPPEEILKEIEIKQGYKILDYGCGPGSFTLAAAKIVGSTGKIHAADIHPLAIKKVRKKVARKDYKNIETIQTSSETGLDDESIDIALLFDILHELSEPESIIKEVHRVLKKEGKLSVTIHHIKEHKGVEIVERTGLFKLENKGKKIHTFKKITQL